MAKIPLRAYIKEIENLIERGEIEPAVAHAKNILRAYPKSIETYRLLGKAYLESQRYSEASDILQRVLSVIPDDFVSQIGMSIIREDEGNMDAAIWHMERAYEVQPFNPAVQDELRRLYGRRDGIEPPKIRLTRGALVRMYTRGELYPQAIAETRAALAEDPQRYDLRVLLARLYYETGQKNDAAEVCSELIAKLPYCYEANRLLTEILPTTSRSEETQKFQQRINALDPYEAFVSPSAPTSAQVPDQAVMVEQTVWEPDAETAQSPDWARTVGAAWEDAEPEEALPEWLNTLKPETAAAEPTAPAMPDETEFAGLDDRAGVSDTDSGGDEEDLVPDWMKEAGWAPSDRPADEIMAEQPDSGEEGEIQPAEIPDWLQSLAPAEAESPVEEEQDRDDWLGNILISSPDSEDAPGEQAADADESVTPDWLAGLAVDEDQPAQSADLPDWLAQMQEEQAQESVSSLPEVSAGEEGTPEIEQFGEDTEPPVETSAEDLPDWLASLQMEEDEESREQPAVTAELAEVGPEVEAVDQPVEEFGHVTAEGEAAEPGDLPEWLQPLHGPTDEVEEEEAEITSLEDVTPDSERMGELPAAEAVGEPVGEMEDEETVPTVLETAETAVEQVQETPAVVDGALESAPDFSDTDATMAWLEALAARQGADEETLITPPDQRTEELPDWLQKETQAQEAMAEETVDGFAAIYDLTEDSGEAVSAEAAAPEEPLETGEEITGTAETITLLEEPVTEPEAVSEEEMTLPEWLASQEDASLEEDAVAMPEAVAADTQAPEIETPEAETPETLIVTGERITEEPSEMQADTEITAEAQAEQAAEASTMPDLSNMDDAMAWLESLAARQGADEATLITPADQRSDTPPDWVSDIKEDAVAQEPVQLEQETGDETPDVSVGITEEEDLPDWLKDTAGWPTQEEDETEISVEEPVSSVEDTQPAMSVAQRDGTIEEPAAQEETQDAGDLDWLKDIEAESTSEISSDAPFQWTEEVEVEGEVEVETELPAWLAGEPAEPAAQERAAEVESEGLPEWLAGLEEGSEAITAETPASTTLDYHTAWGPELTPDLDEEEEVAEAAEPMESPAALAELQKSLNQGQLESALEGYSRLIQNDEYLEEVIHDLREALYRYPVDVSLWQTLGDAYAHSDQLQEALDAYTKAEELLR